jgi:hypothetical protein
MILRFKILILLFAFIVLLSHGAWAGENLALLLDNGDNVSISPDGSLIVLPLHCEGESLCGSVTFNVQKVQRFDEQKIQIFMDTQVCKCPACPDPLTDPFCQTCISPSCVTARNALFDEDAIPQIPQPDGNSLLCLHHDGHDPILCSDVSGIFAPEGCAGNLNLDYRCLVVFNLETGNLVRTFLGVFIISVLGN